MKRLAGKWAKRAELGRVPAPTDPNPEFWFLTLTLPSVYADAEQGFKALPVLWDTTRKSYQRFYETWMYMAFVEGQPNRGNMPHFHVLSDVVPPIKPGKKGYVTKHGLHDWAVALGWGFMADLQIVSNSGGAAYVAKYASKQAPNAPKGFRRVRCSQSWPKLPDLGGNAWLVPSKNEEIDQFIIRVSETVNIDPDTLYPRWAAAQLEIKELIRH